MKKIQNEKIIVSISNRTKVSLKVKKDLENIEVLI